mgnify:CR=1 FL=1
MSPVTASSVITAPLCGSVSMPPLAMAATRCSTSSGMPAAWRRAMKLSAIAGQRDAHAARGRSGDAGERRHGDRLVDQHDWESPSARRRRRGSRAAPAITAPKPYSDAVFMAREQRAADRGLAAFGEAFLESPRRRTPRR